MEIKEFEIVGMTKSSVAKLVVNGIDTRIIDIGGGRFLLGGSESAFRQLPQDIQSAIALHFATYGKR